MRRALLAWSFAVGTFMASQAWAEEAILQPDGCVDRAVFDLTWQKYSSFDEENPLSRSLPVQEYEKVQEKIEAADTEIATLTALMELDRQRRLALRDYQDALAKGLKANLLKAFWRMTWITYSTIGGPTGKGGMVSAGKDAAEVLAGDFMGEFITLSSKVAALGKTVGVIKEVIPKTYSKFQGEPGKNPSFADQAGNTVVDGIVETLKSVGSDPVALGVSVASKVVESAGNEILGDADLSEDEIEILRSQNLQNERLKKMIAQSYQVNGQRQDRIGILTAELVALEEQAAAWKEKEKERVLALLNKDCHRCAAGQRWDAVSAACAAEAEPLPADGPQQGPSLTFGKGSLAPSQPAYDVGDEIDISFPYQLEGLPEGGNLALVGKFRIKGKSAAYPLDGEWVTGQVTAAAGAEIYSHSFRVPPDFPSGDYRIEFLFEAAGVVIGPPPALTFHVSGLYAGAVYLLQEGVNLIEQCKPLDAEALLQQVPAAVSGKTSPLYTALRDQASAATERAQTVAGQMGADLENLRMAEDLLNHCQVESSIKALDQLNFAALPESCAQPLRSEAGVLRGRADERVAARAKMRERLAAGSRELDGCRFSAAAAAATDPVFGSGPECEEEAKLAGVAMALARETEKREAAGRAMEEQLGKGESALAGGRPDEAAALAKRVIAAIDSGPAAACYPEQRARAEGLLAPPARQAEVAVTITGARQALQGHQLQLGSAVTVDGVPVQDADVYVYRWESSDGKSVTGKKSITFTPRSPGDKGVRLTVTDPQGRSATAGATIVVPKLLQVSIAADKAEAATGERVMATAAIVDEEELCPCTFEWRAAAIGQTFRAKSVWLGYQQPGQYAVTLEVKDRFGQAASASHVLAVKEGGVANTRGPAVAPNDRAEEERETLRKEREEYQVRERERLARERQEQAQERGERLARERQEQEQERERLERERQAQGRRAEAERLRREQQERGRPAEDDEFFGDLRNRQDNSGAESGGTLGDALFNAIEQVDRANQQHRQESERIEQEWQEGRRQLEERRQQEKDRREAARVQCEKEKQALRDQVAGWQKGLACLEEGKRKSPNNWLDCNGNWTMRSRDVEIDHHRQLVQDGQARLDANCE